jgi:cell pole-organizing protein PopZ
MEDKIMIEDEIIDLTDLLEEGKAPSKIQQGVAQRKRVNEPDSFDLGKEISMEYDVSVEEIEHDAEAISMDKSPSLGEETLDRDKLKNDVPDLSKESSLRGIETEIDMAIEDKEKYEEVSLTSNEQEMLLKEGPAEESHALIEEKASPIEPESKASPEETRQAEAIPEPVTHMPEAARDETSRGLGGTEGYNAPSFNVGSIPTEAITEALKSEIKKDMPTLLEGIIRPLVKELLQDIIASTRDALPPIVEKVIREEIEKLKKL